MIGIYKITNRINNHCYIGQSTQIEKRWSNHKIASFNKEDKAYEYPLYRAFRKYGIENFDFIVIEECSNEKLNEREAYWIQYYNPEYNQTEGGDYQTVPQKLTYEQVKEIQQILINDVNGEISHKELGEKYGVSGKDTIRDINTGRTWYNADLTYPLHLSKYDARREKKKNYCIDCGKEIFKTSTRCNDCNNKFKKQQSKDNLPVTREELKNLIRTMPMTKVAEKFGYTDNAIRKWCDKFNLPRKVKDIKSYSDKEWELI